MLKVNDIFKEIGTMVYEQGDMIGKFVGKIYALIWGWGVVTCIRYKYAQYVICVTYLTF